MVLANHRMPFRFLAPQRSSNNHNLDLRRSKHRKHTKTKLKLNKLNINKTLFLKQLKKKQETNYLGSKCMSFDAKMTSFDIDTHING